MLVFEGKVWLKFSHQAAGTVTRAVIHIANLGPRRADTEVVGVQVCLTLEFTYVRRLPHSQPTGERYDFPTVV